MIQERPRMVCDGCAKEMAETYNHSACIRLAEEAGWLLGVVAIDGKPADLCPACYRNRVQRFKPVTDQ